MTVYANRKPVPGTTRKPTPTETVNKRREARRLWKLNAKGPNEQGVCAIYGRRHAVR